MVELAIEFDGEVFRHHMIVSEQNDEVHFELDLLQASGRKDEIRRTREECDGK